MLKDNINASNVTINKKSISGSISAVTNCNAIFCPIGKFSSIKLSRMLLNSNNKLYFIGAGKVGDPETTFVLDNGNFIELTGMKGWTDISDTYRYYAVSEKYIFIIFVTGYIIKVVRYDIASNTIKDTLSIPCEMVFYPRTLVYNNDLYFIAPISTVSGYYIYKLDDVSGTLIKIQTVYDVYMPSQFFYLNGVFYAVSSSTSTSIYNTSTPNTLIDFPCAKGNTYSDNTTDSEVPFGFKQIGNYICRIQIYTNAPTARHIEIQYFDGTNKIIRDLTTSYQYEDGKYFDAILHDNAIKIISDQGSIAITSVNSSKYTMQDVPNCTREVNPCTGGDREGLNLNAKYKLGIYNNKLCIYPDTNLALTPSNGFYYDDMISIIYENVYKIQ